MSARLPLAQKGRCVRMKLWMVVSAGMDEEEEEEEEWGARGAEQKSGPMTASLMKSGEEQCGSEKSVREASLGREAERRAVVRVARERRVMSVDSATGGGSGDGRGDGDDWRRSRRIFLGPREWSSRLGVWRARDLPI